MSVVFPDHPEVDESRWIDEVVAMEPFDHYAVEPGIVPIDVFSEDMGNTGTPDANPLRVMWAATGPIAAATKANTVLMGFGGDEINDQRQLLIDRLRYGSLGDRYRVARAHQRSSSIGLTGILASEARDHVPEWVRRPLRRVVPRRDRHLDLRTTDLVDHDVGEPLLLAGLTQDFRRATQFGVVATTQTALLTRILELEERGMHRLATGSRTPIWTVSSWSTWLRSPSRIDRSTVDRRPSCGRAMWGGCQSRSSSAAPTPYPTHISTTSFPDTGRPS